jgi:hypothetical protein
MVVFDRVHALLEGTCCCDPHMQVFASKTGRFRLPKASPCVPDATDVDGFALGEVRGDPQRLGPGSYRLPDPWTGNKVRE